jgi:hypothetical protein
MLRRLIALLLTIYAIAFALGALTAVRWPSMLMLLGWSAPEGVSPRELGLTHAAAYLIAALGYYASGALIARRRGGAVFWYAVALIASVPAALLVDFEPGWWRDPGAGEGAMAGLMLGALLLLAAVWELRKRAPEYYDVEVTPESLAHPQVAAAVAAHQAAFFQLPDLFNFTPDPEKPRKVHPPLFVSDIVVRRQRAMFAAQARRRQARREAALARRYGVWEEDEDDDAA